MSKAFIHTGGHGRSVRNYHTDHECRLAPAQENRRPIDEENIERRGLDECSECAGTVKKNTGNDPYKYIRQIQNND